MFELGDRVYKWVPYMQHGTKRLYGNIVSISGSQAIVMHDDLNESIHEISSLHMDISCSIVKIAKQKGYKIIEK